MAVTAEGIAEAMVAALNDVANNAEFPEEFTASWEYVVSTDYTKYTTDPSVIIIPREETNEVEDRDEDRFQLGVGIAVIRKVETYDKTVIKELLKLPRSIRKFLRNKEMAGTEHKNTSIEVLYGHRELHQDTALVTTLLSDYWIDQ